jgi:hypothetical protein
MKKIIFVLSIILLTGNFVFSQETQRLPKKPKKIKVADIKTYGLPPDLDLPPGFPCPQQIIIPPAPNEVLEERLIIVIHGKPQVIRITSGPNGTVLTTIFETSSGMPINETFELSFQSRIAGMRHSENEYGLIHFAYENRGIIRFIDFYIP